MKVILIISDFSKKLAQIQLEIPEENPLMHTIVKKIQQEFVNLKHSIPDVYFIEDVLHNKINVKNSHLNLRAAELKVKSGTCITVKRGDVGDEKIAALSDFTETEVNPLFLIEDLLKKYNIVDSSFFDYYYEKNHMDQVQIVFSSTVYNAYTGRIESTEGLKTLEIIRVQLIYIFSMLEVDCKISVSRQPVGKESLFYINCKASMENWNKLAKQLALSTNSSIKLKLLTAKLREDKPSIDAISSLLSELTTLDFSQETLWNKEIQVLCAALETNSSVISLNFGDVIYSDKKQIKRSFKSLVAHNSTLLKLTGFFLEEINLADELKSSKIINFQKDSLGLEDSTAVVEKNWQLRNYLQAYSHFYMHSYLSIKQAISSSVVSIITEYLAEDIEYRSLLVRYDDQFELRLINRIAYQLEKLAFIKSKIDIRILAPSIILEIDFAMRFSQYGNSFLYFALENIRQRLQQYLSQLNQSNESLETENFLSRIQPDKTSGPIIWDYMKQLIKPTGRPISDNFFSLPPPPPADEKELLVQFQPLL